MKLILVYNKRNGVVRLLNLDGGDSEKQSNYCLEAWCAEDGENFRHTVWNNDSISPLNPHKHNRVNLRYNKDGKAILQSYYCIHKVVVDDNMEFHGGYTLSKDLL